MTSKVSESNINLQAKDSEANRNPQADTKLEVTEAEPEGIDKFRK